MLVNVTPPDEIRPDRSPATGTLAGTPGQQALDRLTSLAGDRVALDATERRLIETARDHGETWESLAAVLGKGSGQSMQQRYRRLGGHRSWPTRTAPPNADPPPNAVAVDGAGRLWPVCTVAQLQPGDQMPRTLTELRKLDGTWVTITAIREGTEPGMLAIEFDLPGDQQGTWPNADPDQATPVRRTSEILALKTSAQAVMWWEARDRGLNDELAEHLHSFGITPATIDDGDAVVAALHAATRDPATCWQIARWNQRAHQRLRPEPAQD